MGITELGQLAGGIGLFLLGMKLMTEGLQLSAGDALRNLLSNWTRTPVRGLAGGVLITSLVQSSSAVTVAVIGFVNAGLLSLSQTIYVIYGTNIGTTMTSWIVALSGFSVNLKAFALPLIAVGMAMNVIRMQRRYQALGMALAGFGLFFLGIDILKEAFEGYSHSIDLNTWASDNTGGYILLAGLGFVLTFLMQSSSAAMALTLTAAAGGLINLHGAAAMVIGANVGTTSTAALAVIGATSMAQRTAAAHVIFNLITALVAVVVLVPLLYLITWFAEVTGLGHSAAVVLAMFHTFFNILGVMLLWPLTPRLVTWLEARFHKREVATDKPRYLDNNVLTTPDLAMEAVTKELHYMGSQVQAVAMDALNTEQTTGEQIPVGIRAIDQLGEQIDQFCVKMQRAQLAPAIASDLPVILRVSRYYRDVAEQAGHIAEAQRELADVEDTALAEIIAHFRSESLRLLEECQPRDADFSTSQCQLLLEELEIHYQELKAELLRAGAREHIRIRQMVLQLDQFSAIRRMLEQAQKGANHLSLIGKHEVETENPASEASAAETPQG